MNYGLLRNCDTANGPGVRVSLFVSGCTNNCLGCFNQETQDFCYGKPFTEETEAQIIELLKPDYISGITLLGGDPFEPANQKALLPFIQKIRLMFPNKTIWAYSGFTWEELHEMSAEESYPRLEDEENATSITDMFLSCLDVLVDGRFIMAKKDISLRFRGSSNQRIIDVQETLKAGHVVRSHFENRD